MLYKHGARYNPVIMFCSVIDAHMLGNVLMWSFFIYLAFMAHQDRKLERVTQPCVTSHILFSSYYKIRET